MDIQLIKKLVQLVKDNEVGELKIEEDNFKITIKHKDFIASKTIAAAPIMSNQAAPSPQVVIEDKQPAPKETTPISSNTVTVKAPMIGTFYRSAGPDKEVFVKVGDTVKKGDVLCIIEAMKLFNEIQSEVSGKIIKVLVDNEQAVEYDQALFLIEP